MSGAGESGADESGADESGTRDRIGLRAGWDIAELVGEAPELGPW